MAQPDTGQHARRLYYLLPPVEGGGGGLLQGNSQDHPSYIGESIHDTYYESQLVFSFDNSNTGENVFDNPKISQNCSNFSFDTQ